MLQSRVYPVFVLGVGGFPFPPEASLTIPSNRHDAAAVLVTDGAVAVAVDKERITGVEHRNRFPQTPILACFARPDIGLDEALELPMSNPSVTCTDPWPLPQAALCAVSCAPSQATI
jgi:hypothetical protein